MLYYTWEHLFAVSQADVAIKIVFLYYLFLF